MTFSRLFKEEFRALLKRDHPERVYHYTKKLDALKKIISSRVFHATHRGRLNDPVDLTCPLETSIRLVRDWTDGRSGWEKGIGDEVLKKLRKMLSEAASSHFSFSVSFTDVGDGVEQWERYGADGRGFAISFDFECLFNSVVEQDFLNPETGDMTGHHFLMGKVEYDERNQRRQVFRLLDVAIKCWPKARRFFPVSPEQRIAHAVAISLEALSRMTFKSGEHIKESEWKATPNAVAPELVKANGERAFIEMRFDPSCIRSIVVGSSFHEPFEGVKRTLELFLETHNLTKVEIRQSRI